MRGNNGFFLVETAMLLLFVCGLMITTIHSYNICLRNVLREKELSQALSYCEEAMYGNSDFVVQAGLNVQKLNHECSGFTITEIRVIKDEQVIFNIFQVK